MGYNTKAEMTESTDPRKFIGLIRIRLQLAIHFCLHRGKFASKHGKLASHVILRIIELLASSPDEFHRQRTLEGRFSGLNDPQERGRGRRMLWHIPIRMSLIGLTAN